MTNYIYPNAPLVETTFEIRFNGEPAIECNRDKFFNEIRSKYPKVYVPVPKKEAEQPLALIPYRFQSDDEQSGVMVALNSFAFYTKKYEGFAIFKNEALRLMNLFVTMFQISKLNRTGLRYIDIIPFIRDSKRLIPYQNYLNFNLKLPDVYSKDYTSFSTVFNTLTPSGSITTRIENLESKYSSQEAILVDFDYAKVDSLDSSELDKYIEESHSYTKNIFESLITDSYRKYMEGGTIE